MTDSPHLAELPAMLEAAHDRTPGAEEAQALLQDCVREFKTRVFEAARGSMDLASDLFESTTGVPDGEIESFRSKRGEWIERFENSMTESLVQWQAGRRRSGRRPDRDASAATLSVMTPVDQEKQAALVEATAFLRRFTRREQSALTARIGALVPGPSREQDNPFGPEYVLDALGVASRGVYPLPRIWRSLMVRLLADLTPALNKIYISLNRMLADRGVLPDMKAALRARSEFRPDDDKDLLPTFTRMMSEAATLPTDVVVPSLSDIAASAPAASESDAPAVAGIPTTMSGDPPPASVAPAPLVPPAGSYMPAPAILAGLAALAELGNRASAGQVAPGRAALASDFPDLDPMMALGSSTPLFATLGHWQRLDLPAALLQAMPQPAPGETARAMPLNLVPHIRAAVTEQVANPADRIAMDVIALLFDYVFRDPSIPDRLRRLFGRLQVPIVKAALLDRTFFSDRRHPARLLLDHLAEGAIGATANETYGEAFEAAAARVIDDVCRDFEIDIAVFARADAELVAFLDSERREAAPALNDHVAVALAAEESEADRSHVRALVRDHLAGLELPFEVRTFAETVWADYLTSLRKELGPESEAWRAALGTLDDLLWSIVIKERTAQKARLTKMIPALILGLRRGCKAVAVDGDRSKPFFDALYALHMAALKPVAGATPAQPAAKAADVAAATGAPASEVTAAPPANVHDFVSEMAVGTWLRFGTEGAVVNARLSWVSPLRTKYVFTSRSRTQAYVFSPEELAWELGTGRAALVVEPVPLFDRAVSAALDTLAAQRPPEKAAA
ncbi:MAG: DUF1631 family protein [Casimicrobiaceae bacterium]